MTPPERESPRYASLAAFLAHYRALSGADARSAEEDRILAAMHQYLDAIPAEERAALASTADSGPARRHRERAELHLRRALLAQGAIAG